MMKTYKAEANIENLRSYDSPALPDFDDLHVQRVYDCDFLVVDAENNKVFTCYAESELEAVSNYIAHLIPDMLHVWAEDEYGDAEPTDDLRPAKDFYTIAATNYTGWDYETTKG